MTSIPFPRVTNLWGDICTYIIRPPKAQYTLSDLGPKNFYLRKGSKTVFSRTDLELENMRGYKLMASWYHPKLYKTKIPCIVYLHGNCGSRESGWEIMGLLEEGFTIFTFDATGCGLSEGEYISLGFYEIQDLSAAVEYLHSTNKVSCIGLWGRSMGAVTAIMYASKDSAIRCIVCDSPYSTLRFLIQDLIDKYGKNIVPNYLVKLAMRKIQKKVAELAVFDIDDLNTIKYAKVTRCPAFMFHGKDDNFVRCDHSLLIAENYGGSCIHKIISGDHNSCRKKEVFDVAIPFLKLYLIEKPDAETMLAEVKLNEEKIMHETQKNNEDIKETVAKAEINVSTETEVNSESTDNP